MIWGSWLSAAFAFILSIDLRTPGRPPLRISRANRCCSSGRDSRTALRCTCFALRPGRPRSGRLRSATPVVGAGLSGTTTIAVSLRTTGSPAILRLVLAVVTALRGGAAGGIVGGALATAGLAVAALAPVVAAVVVGAPLAPVSPFLVASATLIVAVAPAVAVPSAITVSGPLSWTVRTLAPAPRRLRHEPGGDQRASAATDQLQAVGSFGPFLGCEHRGDLQTVETPVGLRLEHTSDRRAVGHQISP